MYLINPAAVRKPIKRAKPYQTPRMPIIGGAYSKKMEDSAPTNICTSFTNILTKNKDIEENKRSY